MLQLSRQACRASWRSIWGNLCIIEYHHYGEAGKDVQGARQRCSIKEVTGWVKIEMQLERAAQESVSVSVLEIDERATGERATRWT
jgi:uncharacterized protein YjlB